MALGSAGHRIIGAVLAIWLLWASSAAVAHQHPTAAAGVIRTDCQLCVWLHTRVDCGAARPILPAALPIIGLLSPLPELPIQPAPPVRHVPRAPPSH